MSAFGLFGTSQYLASGSVFFFSTQKWYVASSSWT